MLVGFGQSLVVENAFNHTTYQYRDAKGLKVCRERRYYTPIVKGVVSNVYKRPKVLLGTDTESLEGQRPRSLPKGAFESQGGTSSLGPGVLERIRDKTTWPVYTPLGSHSIVTAWQLLLRIYARGAWEEAAEAWKAIFVPPSVVVRAASDAGCHLVLHSDQYGLLATPVSLGERIGSTTALSFPKTIKLEHLSVVSFEQYTVMEIHRCGPNELRYTHRQTGVSGVVQLCAAMPTPILTHIADGAFIGITGVWLRRLISYLGVSAKDFGLEGSTVLTHVEVLIRAILSDITDEAVAEIMSKSLPKKCEDGIVLHDGHADLLDQVLDSGDKKDAKIAGREAAERRDVAASDVKCFKSRPWWGRVEGALKGLGSKVLDIESGGASSSGSKSRERGKVAAQKVARLSNFKLDFARSLLPRHKGCLIQDYPTKNAFQVYYSESTTAPRSKHFTFSEKGFSEQEVLLACVRWAWHKHKGHTGIECPPCAAPA